MGFTGLEIDARTFVNFGFVAASFGAVLYRATADFSWFTALLASLRTAAVEAGRARLGVFREDCLADLATEGVWNRFLG